VEASGKKTSRLILRRLVRAASPTGILAFSSRITYSSPGLTAPFTFDRHDVERDLPDRHRTEAVREVWIVEDARLYDLFRDDLLDARLQPAQKLVHRPHSLDEAALQTLPFGGGNDAREPVGRVGLIRPPGYRRRAARLTEDRAPRRFSSQRSGPVFSSSSKIGA
jgi:hypothetical protein